MAESGGPGPRTSTLIVDAPVVVPASGAVARLVPVGGCSLAAVDITKDVTVIGRNEGCDVTFADEPRMSGKHCTLYVESDDELGRRFLVEDSSTNGVFLNGHRVAKGKRVPIPQGAELGLVVDETAGRKVSFVVQELAVADTVVDGAKRRKGDDFLTILTCSICLEVMHKPVAALPCLHKFCAGCLSECLASKRECPTCRTVVRSTAVDHAMMSVVDAYLNQHPDQRRPPEDLAELDAKDTISGAPVGGSGPRARSQSRSDSEEEDWDDEEDEEDEDDSQPPLFGGGFTFSFAPTAPVTTCQLCAPSHPVPPANGVTCPGAHRRCADCRQLVPDPAPGVGVPLACALCSMAHCGPYWGAVFPGAGVGCPSGGAVGFRKLRDFKNTPFVVFLPSQSFNAFELDAFTRALRRAGITPAQVFSDMVDRLDAGTSVYPPGTSPAVVDLSAPAAASGVDSGGATGSALPPPPSAAGAGAGVDAATAAPAPAPAPAAVGVGVSISGDSYVDVSCFMKVWKALAFEYRAEVNPALMPPEIVARPKCWYGRTCRTQWHNPSHQSRLNHVCEPTPSDERK